METPKLDTNKQRIWFIVLYLIVIVLLLRVFPKAAYGLMAITLLVLLLKSNIGK